MFLDFNSFRYLEKLGTPIIQLSDFEKVAPLSVFEENYCVHAYGSRRYIPVEIEFKSPKIQPLQKPYSFSFSVFFNSGHILSLDQEQGFPQVEEFCMEFSKFLTNYGIASLNLHKPVRVDTFILNGNIFALKYEEKILNLFYWYKNNSWRTTL